MHIKFEKTFSFFQCGKFQHEAHQEKLSHTNTWKKNRKIYSSSSSKSNSHQGWEGRRRHPQDQRRWWRQQEEGRSTWKKERSTWQKIWKKGKSSFRKQGDCSTTEQKTKTKQKTKTGRFNHPENRKLNRKQRGLTIQSCLQGRRHCSWTQSCRPGRQARQNLVDVCEERLNEGSPGSICMGVKKKR